MCRAWGGLVALACALGAAAAPGVEPAPQDFKVEEGFVSLFNGKDLSGWRYVGSKESLEGKTETPDKRFQVVDSAIVAQAKDDKGKGGIKDLFTGKDFNKPFHL